MDSSESRIAPSSEAEFDDFVSPSHPRPAIPGPLRAGPPAGLEPDDAYWRGVADGLARAGVAVPADVAARSGAPPAGRGDLLDFEPVPLRHRSDGLTLERQRAYVEALADCGVAREAAARVGVTEQSVARVRRRADAHSFDRACEAAHRFGARRLRSIAFERAIEGTLKGHYYHGELISQERVHDNRLLIYLLGKTEEFLDPPADVETICANWEPYMDALERGLPEPEREPSPPGFVLSEFSGQEVTKDPDGTRWTIFPPPPGFAGEEEGQFGDDDYRRTLTPEEEAVILADEEEELAEELAARDRYFGFDEPSEADDEEDEEDEGEDEEDQEEIFDPREAEPSEPSAPAPHSAPEASGPGPDLDRGPECDIRPRPDHSERGTSG